MIDADGSHRARLGDGVVPLAWYEPETYEDIKALMTDGRSFAATYAHWEGQAKQVEAFFLAKVRPDSPGARRSARVCCMVRRFTTKP